MAIIQKKLPLFNDAFYNYSVALEGNTFHLTFTYIKRTNTWTFDISDSQRNILARGQRLTPNTALMNDYQLPNLSGFFYFTPIKDQDPDELEDRVRRPKGYFNLFYYYDDGN